MVTVMSSKTPVTDILFHNLEAKLGHNNDYFLGKVLTVIDAAIADTDQRKAIKDIIRPIFWDLNHQNRGALFEVIGQLYDKLYGDGSDKAARHTPPSWYTELNRTHALPEDMANYFNNMTLDV